VERKQQVKDRTRAQAGMKAARYGEAEPSPHIERQSRNTTASLAALVHCVLCASVVGFWRRFHNHRRTEDTEVAQRNAD